MSEGGSTARLYECEPKRSPLRILKKCYDMIPIDDLGQLKFVEPISRQTFDIENAREIKCGHELQNLFHMDLKDKRSWYTLEPRPRLHDQPEIFKPDIIAPITPITTYSTVKSGLYSSKRISKLWEKLLSQRQGEGMLKTLTIELQNNANEFKSDGTKGPWRPNPGRYGLGKPIYFDNMMSPKFFKFAFIKEFGKWAWIITQIGSWVAFFMFFQYAYKVLIIVCRGMNIHNMVGYSVSLVRIVTDATFNTLLVAKRQDELLKSQEDKEMENKQEKESLRKSCKIYPFIENLRSNPTSECSDREHFKDSY